MQSPPSMSRAASWYLSGTIIAFKIGIGGWLMWHFIQSPEAGAFLFDQYFWWFLLIGFCAQLIDGALGMAYGVTSNSLLLWLGVPPALASASVHTAKVFASGMSGLSHLYFKNVDMRLFLRLVIPGSIGGILGAFLLSDILDGDVIRPYIAIYLLILGIWIIIKGIRKISIREEIRNVAPLGFFGGVMDAIGGGGWGPIVTSNIIRKGNAPHITIGTVNTAEFFVALFSTGIFLILLGMQGWQILLGLIIGGMLAAPLGAYLIRFIQPRILLIFVGLVVIATSCLTIFR